MISNRPDRPLWATVNVTGVCNLKCEYCFFQPRKYEHMSISNYKKVVKILKEQELFFLTISGGEPFLHPQINEILKHAHDEFEYATVLSNGTTITKDNIACMKQIITQKGYFPIQVSLDAIDPDVNDKTRGMADKVQKNLELLRDTGVSLTIAIVVSSQNIEQVVDTIINSKHLTKHFHLMPFKAVPYLKHGDKYLHSEISDMKKVWETLENIRDKHNLQIRLPSDECKSDKYSATGAPCVAGFTQIVIDPNLDVRACSRCTHAIVGNLQKESMENIWHGEKLAHIYKSKVPYCHIHSEWDNAVKDPSFLQGKQGAKEKRFHVTV